MLILVDEKDVPTGKYEDKGECHFGDGLHHRAFVVLLENSQGEVLLQKRKHVRWDGYLDVSAISHVLHFDDHDETYEEAALRALKTEMGINKVKLTKIGGFNYFAKYFAHCENEYCAVLVGKYDGKIHANQDVVYEAVWIPKETFLREVKERSDMYTPWAILAAELLEKQQ